MEEHAYRSEFGVAPVAEPEESAAWEKLRRLAEKHRASDDPDISKALEGALVAEAQALALTAKAKPAWLSDFPLVSGFFSSLPSSLSQEVSATSDTSDESEKPDSIQIQDADVPNDVDTAERLIREAHLFTMRGDKAKAKELLDRAEKAAPRSGPVLVALADAAIERHNVKEAIRLLNIAKDANPGNVAIEKRHADAVFRQTQGMIFDPTSRSSSFENAASAKAAVILSMMLPGLGQIVTGRLVTGVVIVTLWVGSLVTLYLIGFEHFFAAVGLGPSKDAIYMTFVPVAIAVLTHLFAILDASAKAKTVDKPKIIRPVPPSDLPFE